MSVGSIFRAFWSSVARRKHRLIYFGWGLLDKNSSKKLFTSNASKAVFLIIFAGKLGPLVGTLEPKPDLLRVADDGFL